MTTPKPDEQVMEETLEAMFERPKFLRDLRSPCLHQFAMIAAENAHAITLSMEDQRIASAAWKDTQRSRIRTAHTYAALKPEAKPFAPLATARGQVSRNQARPDATFNSDMPVDFLEASHA